MKCKCGTYCSGDKCKGCGAVLRSKPEKESKPKNKKPIRHKSAKKESEDLIYKAKRIKFLKENPRCQVYPWLNATDIHHKRGRGEYYLDESTWIAVSMEAHNEIESDPDWAYEMGYSELRLKKYD